MESNACVELRFIDNKKKLRRGEMFRLIDSKPAGFHRPAFVWKPSKETKTKQGKKKGCARFITRICYLFLEDCSLCLAPAIKSHSELNKALVQHSSSRRLLCLFGQASITAMTPRDSLRSGSFFISKRHRETKMQCIILEVYNIYLKPTKAVFQNQWSLNARWLSPDSSSRFFFWSKRKNVIFVVKRCTYRDTTM